MEEIGPQVSSWVDVGATSLIVLALILGWVVPYRQLRDLRFDRDKRVQELENRIEEIKRDRDQRITEISEERDDWREVAQNTTQAYNTTSRQLDEALEGARLTQDIIRAIPKPSE